MKRNDTDTTQDSANDTSRQTERPRIDAKFIRTVENLKDLTEDSTLFVINNIPYATKGEITGAYVLSIRVGPKEFEPLTISDTWLPQDVSLQQNASVLKKDPAFRRALASRFILVVDEAYAAQLLATDAAAVEQSRLDQRAKKLDEEDESESFIQGGFDDERISNGSSEPYASDLAVDIFRRYRANRLTAAEAAAAIRGVAGVAKAEALHSLLSEDMPNAIHQAVEEALKSKGGSAAAKKPAGSMESPPVRREPNAAKAPVRAAAGSFLGSKKVSSR